MYRLYRKIMAGYYGFTLDVRMSICLSVSGMSFLPFLFPDDNLSKRQWIFTKLGMCFDIVEIWFGIAVIIAGYYSLTFLFICFVFFVWIKHF